MNTNPPSNTSTTVSQNLQLVNGINLLLSPHGGGRMFTLQDDETTIGGQKVVLHSQNALTTFCPRNQADIDKRSWIMSENLQRVRAVAKSVLQGGTISEDKQWLQSQAWSVRIAGESNSPIPIGGFLNNQTGQYGFDLIELFAALRNLDYFQAMETFVEHLGLASDCEGQADQKKRYIQEKAPLSLPPLPDGAVTNHFAPLAHVAVYWSAAELPIGLVFHWVLPNGQMVSQHTTLWRHNQSEILHWVDLFPQPPYTLYNRHLMVGSIAPVYIFSSEARAGQSVYAHPPNRIHSACPGGIKNLKDADLSPLRFRDVHIEVLLQSEIQVLPDIIKKMKQVCVREIYLFLPGHTSPVTGDDFMKAPKAHGYYQLACEKVKNTPSSKSIITEPGESIPGSDIKRKMLIDPIIREGEIVWLYGKEKAGKSWLGIVLAYILSKGNLTAGKWSVDERQDVLYIDGEMLPDDFENNIKMVMKGVGDDSGEIPFYRQCAKALPGGQINLLEDTGQAIADRFPDSIKLAVLDNFYCLTDNKVNDIKAMSGLLHMLSQKDIAVLVLDHTNSEGELQGSRSKRRVANLGIEIEDIGDNRLRISHPFARRLHGEEAQSYVVRKSFSDDSFHIELEEAMPYSTPVSEKIQQLAWIKYYVEVAKESYEEIEKRYGTPRSTANHQYTKQIPKLGVEERAQLDEEFDRISTSISC